MDDKEYQKKNLEKIYRDASLAPAFQQHPKYCTGDFAEVTPYIAYDDIMDEKYIIRGRGIGARINGFDNEKRQIIVEYSSIDDLVNDGWRLD
jgi:hypothetical protein